MKATLFASLVVNALLAALLLLVARTSGVVAHRAANLHSEGLLGVSVGDSCDAVVRKIGYPVDLRARDATKLSFREQSEPWPQVMVWRYAVPGILGSAPEVSIAMRDCRVELVSVQRDDRTVFQKSGSTSVGDEASLRALLDD